MTKRFMPATIAALAISLTSLTAPSAVAATIDTPIVASESIDLTRADLLALADIDDAPDTTGASIISVEFELDDAPVSWVTYNLATQKLVVADNAPAGTHTLDVTITTRVGTTDDEHEGTITLTVLGAAVSGTANELQVSNRAQGTGLKLENYDTVTETVIVDEDGTEVPHRLNINDEIVIDSTEGLDGPLTLTVTDPSLAEPLKRFIQIQGHAADRDDNDSDVVLGGTPGDVEASNTYQDTGVTIANNTDATVITAVDEDGQTLLTRIEDGKIQVRPGADVDGPITLTITDASLEDGEKEFTVNVNGHEADRDDNDSEVLTIGGTARTLVANGTKQDTGLTVSYGEGATVAATDANDEEVTADIDNGKIYLTPSVDTVGPVTVTVTPAAAGSGTPQTRTIEINPADSGSSLPGSSDGDNVVAIGLAAVLATVIGVIAAIAGGFIPVPPAIQALLPF